MCTKYWLLIWSDDFATRKWWMISFTTQCRAIMTKNFPINQSYPVFVASVFEQQTAWAWLCISSYFWAYPNFLCTLDLCKLPRLIFWGKKMKTPHGFPGILAMTSAMDYIKQTENKPCLILIIEKLAYFIKFKMICLCAW